MQVGSAGFIGAARLGDIAERHALAGGVHPLARHVVKTQHHVLGRHNHRLTVRRRKHVVGRHHQGARLKLRLDRQRHMNGHLVAVKVGVERGTYQRMQLDRLALDQHRLKRLDTQTVQGRRSVEHDRVFADYLFEDIPHLRRTTLDQLLGRLDGGGKATELQLREDERLEQLQRHLLRDTALVQLQRRTDHDDRTARIVDTLAQQVLAETPLLALDHVGQRLQWALVGTGDGTTTATVVEQRIDRLLQHALLVAHDDIGRVQVEQPLESIVAVDHATVQIVQVRGRETTTVERHQRTQLGRQHRQHGQNHPLRTVARLQQRFEQFQALGDLLDLGLGIGALDVLTHARDFFRDVHGAQQFVDRLGTHARIELIAVFLDCLEVLLISQQLETLQRGHARIDHHIRLEVQHALDVTQGDVEQQADTRRQ